MKDRLDFMACPCCSGHEVMSTEAMMALSDAIELHLTADLPENVAGELRNINNVILNSMQPGRPEPARPEESWLDA